MTSVLTQRQLDNNSVAAQTSAMDELTHSYKWFGHAVPKALVWVLAVSLLMNATAIWCGVQAGNSSDWADDSVSPWEVVHCVQDNCSEAWPNKYPPFHAYL